MKKTLIIFALCCVHVAAVAKHTPGYMGKKFSVGFNASSFFMFEDFSSVSDMLFSTRFSYKSEFALNYTVSRKVSLGGSFYYGNQRYLPNPKDVIIGNYGYEMIPKDDYINCKLMIFEANIKIFRKNFIAPIGPYHQFGIGMVKYGANVEGDSLVLLREGSASTYTLDIEDEMYSCVKLSYHIGYAAPVFSNCYFNFAFGVNFFRGGDSAKIKGEVSSSEYVLSVLNQHLRRHNFLEVKLGFGWLAF